MYSKLRLHGECTHLVTLLDNSWAVAGRPKRFLTPQGRLNRLNRPVGKEANVAFEANMPIHPVHASHLQQLITLGSPLLDENTNV